MKRVVILGGGSGGAVAASRLAKWSNPDEFEVVLVDRSPWHEYRPSYLWLMTGRRTPDQVRRPLNLLEKRYGTRVMQSPVTSIDPRANQVSTDWGNLDYDYLVVSLGSVVHQDETTAGLDAPWELGASMRLHDRLSTFDGGRVVVGPHSWPYRCPPAPFETAMLIAYLADQRHVRRNTEVTVFHPWAEPMEIFGPEMTRGFKKMLDEAGIRFEGSFHFAHHDLSNSEIVSKDGRRLPYDLGVLVPQHGPPPVIADSPLAGAGGYMDVELPSMLHPSYPNVWGIGDVVAPTIGLGMAGIFAHFQAEHVVTQILDRSRGVYLGELYNTVGFCVMDTGYAGTAVWCDFAEKLAGKAPLPDCRLVGGMRSFRAIKVGFEQFWFANLFGRETSLASRSGAAS